jgi:hypothetical protein
VITTKGTKTAWEQRVRWMEDQSCGRLTKAAPINNMRIDFLRPQIAHVLKANITGLNHISSGNLSLSIGFLRSEKSIAKTRRPGIRGQSHVTFGSLGAYNSLCCSSSRGTWALTIIRHTGRVEKFQEYLTGIKTSRTVRNAGYRAQTNRVLARVHLVFHTYLI